VVRHLILIIQPGRCKMMSNILSDTPYLEG
jgi:hypothetical protein